MTFDPGQHVKNLGSAQQPRLYLEARWRLVWFREENPNGRIETKIERLDNEMAVVSACVIGDTGAVGSGLGMCLVANARNISGRYVEKAETAAIARALATIGYGTQYTDQEYEDSQDLSDAPLEAPQDRSAPEPVAPRQYDGPKYMPAKFKGKCVECGESIAEGEQIAYWSATKQAAHAACGGEAG